MIKTKPQVDNDGLYNISETAKALGVERHTVMRYISNGAIKFRVRKCDNRKVTRGKDIIECWENMYI